MPEPAWPHRRELYIDARDLQSDSDPDHPMSPADYAAALASRGLEKLAEHQLVRSFAAEVRTYDPTYVCGQDFFMGDTITVTDERLGVSVDAVVQAVQRTAGENGETLTLTMGYGPPTLGDILKRKAGR